MWEIVRANKRRAALLVGIETLILGVTGFVFFEAFSPGSGTLGLVVGTAIAAALFFTGYFVGDQALLAVSGAREISGREYPQLINIVEEMKIAAGLPRTPRVFVIDEEVPNAFACGRNPDCAAVAVTSGLLKRLNRDELQGVIAHELGHIANRDILYMTLVSVMVGAVAILAQFFLRATFWGGVRTRTSSRRDEGGAQAIMVLLAVVLAILAPVFARLVYLAVSRRREYLADASSAIFTRYPEGLASALEKIAGHQGKMKKESSAMAPLYIVPPGKMALKGGSGLWSTHPPTEKRIAVLRSIGGAISYQAYQEAFRRVSGGERETLFSSRAVVEAKAVEKRAPSPEEKKEEQARRVRQVTDLLWLTQGFRFANCGCGLKFKVPGDYEKEIKCPRCGRAVKVPGGGPKNPPPRESA